MTPQYLPSGPFRTVPDAVSAKCNLIAASILRAGSLLIAMFGAAGAMILSVGLTAQPASGAENPTTPEVTLLGVLMNNEACTRGLTESQRKDEKLVPVFFALEGPPEITATFLDVTKELVAGNSIDYAGAKQIEEDCNKRVKYFLTPGPITDAVKKDWNGPNTGGKFFTVTGVISEKDGKRWITPSKLDSRINARGIFLKYPPGMYAPDKPFKMPRKEPLIIKVTDTLSLRCILLPRGEFMMENPFYALPRWDDEFPRHITLTKPYFLAEIPVTQEMWEAVIGNNPSTVKDPQRPVRNISCPDVLKFCKILSEKNGRKVRLPGEAEWEYALRVGTSNPPFSQKYKAQYSAGKARGECLPVKSKEPNAWGIYDMVSGNAYEITRDKFVLRGSDAVDPYDSCEKEEAAGKDHSHWVRNGGGGSGGLVTYHEGVHLKGTSKDIDYGSPKLRIAVEATPEEIAEMEKFEKK